MNLKNVKIGPRLIAGFVVVALVVGIVGVIGFVNLSGLKSKLDVMYTEHAVPLHDMGVIYSDIYWIRGNVYNYFLYPSDRASMKTEMQSKMSEIDSLLASFKTTDVNDTEIKAVAEFETNWQIYTSEISKILDQVDAGQ